MGALSTSGPIKARLSFSVLIRCGFRILRQSPAVALPVLAGILFQLVHPNYEGLPEVTLERVADGTISDALIAYAASQPLYILFVSTATSVISAVITVWSFRSISRATQPPREPQFEPSVLLDILMFSGLHYVSVGIYLGTFVLAYGIYQLADPLLPPWVVVLPVLAFPLLYAWLSLVAFALTLRGTLRDRLNTLRILSLPGIRIIIRFYAVRTAAEGAILGSLLAASRSLHIPGPLAIGLAASLALLPMAVIRNSGYLLKMKVLKDAPLVRWQRARPGMVLGR